MTASAAVTVDQLSHNYGQRQAICNLDLSIAQGEIFALLGPNGSGKTTLFRLLSTLMPLQQGTASVLGFDLEQQTQEIRRRIGIVFQAPSLDKKLTVAENIRYQAALYGLSGADLSQRMRSLMEQLGVAERAKELTETLSGGLKRRVELAKGMIHRPQLLLLDEPSTGLDPGARLDVWHYLRRLQQELGVTIVLTTHLLEEADQADRIAIMNEGQLVALDSPSNLRSDVGGDAIHIQTTDPESLAVAVQETFSVPTQVLNGAVRLEQTEGHQWIPRIVEAFPDRVESITVGKPTLEDVFIAKTGHRFWQAGEEESVG